MAKRKENRGYIEADNVEDLIEAIEDLEPETEFGKKLKELLLRGLEEGVEPLNPDEIMEYLGRPAYA